jgi:hypothetical protein
MNTQADQHAKATGHRPFKPAIPGDHRCPQGACAIQPPPPPVSNQGQTQEQEQFANLIQNRVHPRINDFIGVNHQNATQWGWRLTPYENRFIVNWPDPQGRLFKNIPNLRWERRLHEKIEGAKTFTYLPYEYDYSLYHYKTIEKQIETNLKYNKQFTSQENQGFKL